MSKAKQYQYKRILSHGFMYVEFIKKDGSLRQMWCTRDNKIIQECGHELIQFGQIEIVRRENRFSNQLYVYDIQENDTRILNVSTIIDTSIQLYENLNEVEIPKIVTRFEKKDKVEEITEEVDSKIESSIQPKIEDSVLGISENEIDDIFK